MTDSRIVPADSPPPSLADENPRGLRKWRWLLLPVALYLSLELISFWFFPRGFDANLSLLIHQAVIALLVIAGVLALRMTGRVGWCLPRGWSWIWLAGPIWLAVITPAGTALAHYQAQPGHLFLFAVISLLVAINEESLFRGSALLCMQESLRPFLAAILSSLAFGTLHVLNLISGGDPILVLAQMFAAAGFGTVMAGVTLHSRSILPAIGFHFSTDFVGLGALGGYSEAIGAREQALPIFMGGLLTMGWGLFWCWRFQRKMMVDEFHDLATKAS